MLRVVASEAAAAEVASGIDEICRQGASPTESKVRYD